MKLIGMILLLTFALFSRDNSSGVNATKKTLFARKEKLRKVPMEWAWRRWRSHDDGFTWFIKANEGERIRTTLENYMEDLYYMYTVRTDVYDEIHGTKRHIGTWDGKKEHTFYSWGNHMWIEAEVVHSVVDLTPTYNIKYQAENLLQLEAAEITIVRNSILKIENPDLALKSLQQIITPCEETITVEDLEIHEISPPHSSQVDDMVSECWWIFHFPLYDQGKLIHLNITTTNLADYDCSTEYVAAFKKIGTREILKMCGTDVRYFDFYLQSMFIQFKTSPDSKQEKSGFRLIYQMVTDTKCAETVQIGGDYKPSGTVSSPNYPLAYPRFQRCTYLLETEAPETIRLHVKATLLNPSCSEEYIKVFDGTSSNSTLLGSLCKFEEQTFRSSGNSLLIVFVSGNEEEKKTNVDSKGFMAKYREGACGNSLQANREEQTVKFLPLSLKQSYDSYCSWALQATDKDQQIILKFSQVDVECAIYNITVIDGEEEGGSEQTFCGNKDFVYLSTGRAMLVKIFSGRQSASFRMTYKSMPVIGCLGKSVTFDAERSAKFIKSPGYPEGYESSLKCIWHIEPKTTREVVTLTLTLLPSDYDENSKSQECLDKVSLYSGRYPDQENVQSICTSEKFFYKTTDRSVTVNLTTRAVEGKGFMIKYSWEQGDTTGAVEKRNMIVGATVGTISVVVLIIIIMCFIKRRSQGDNDNNSEHSNPVAAHTTLPVTHTTLPVTHTNSHLAQIPSPVIPQDNRRGAGDTARDPPSYNQAVDSHSGSTTPMLQDSTEGPSRYLHPSAPELPPPSYEDAVSKGLIVDSQDQRI